ncbi:MAG: type II toxin-antitoxin system VapC family toxin [Rhodospirillales bacterium]|nr:type II toxin-antitoxin system VapC family toxin [Rhodospirillales bacterium]
MIVDSSALLAVVLKEPDEDRFARVMLAAPELQISAANWVEAAIVSEGKHPSAAARFDDLARLLNLRIVPVSEEHAFAARRAWQSFGRGNHTAQLNYGDCFAYALSREAGKPLLFKGNDFARTDIEPALKD